MDTGSETIIKSDIGEAKLKPKKSDLTRDEIRTIIRSKKILGKIGHGSDLNVKKICKDIGLSRKTAYSYAVASEGDKPSISDHSLEDLENELELLKGRLKRVELENEGLRLTKMLFEDFKKKKV